MILEVPFAMIAWVGVVLIQAIVHFGMFGARRDSSAVSGLQAPLVREGSTNCDTNVYFPQDDGSCDAVDEDEGPPEGLETLLSQTGDDVISVSDDGISLTE